MHFTKSSGAGKARFERTQITPKYAVDGTSAAVFVHLEKESVALECWRGNREKKGKTPWPSPLHPHQAYSPYGDCCLPGNKMHQPQQIGHREDGGHRPRSNPKSWIIKNTKLKDNSGVISVWLRVILTAQASQVTPVWKAPSWFYQCSRPGTQLMEVGKRLSTTEMIPCGPPKMRGTQGFRELSHSDGGPRGTV